MDKNYEITTIEGFRATIKDRHNEHWLTFRIYGKKGLFKHDGYGLLSPIREGSTLYYNNNKTKKYYKSDWNEL